MILKKDPTSLSTALGPNHCKFKKWYIPGELQSIRDSLSHCMKGLDSF